MARLRLEPDDAGLAGAILQMSYEEAEAKHNECMRALVDLLRQSADPNTLKARSLLREAVAYASHMNMLHGGEHDDQFKQSLRNELLLTCISASATQKLYEDSPVSID